MVFRFKRHLPWGLAWALASLAGALVLAQWEINSQREGFEANLRVAHQLLSQKLAQNDAVLGQLAQSRLPDSLARPQDARTLDARPRADVRMLSPFPLANPQILSVQRRENEASWLDEPLRAAEAESIRQQRPALADVNLAKGRYNLVLAAEPVSYAVQIDLRAMVPWREWPMLADASPVQVTLSHARQIAVLQAGDAIAENMGTARGWHFEFNQALQSESQPFYLSAQRQFGWGELPWSHIATWSLAVALLLLAVRALLRQRHDRLRAVELLHLGQIGRLNTLTELATGVVHELGEPLATVLQTSQTADALLCQEPLDLAGAQVFVKLGVEEAKRATRVITRLRHVVEQPDLSGQLEAIDLQVAARAALDLLASEFTRLGLRATVALSGPPFTVLAQADALEQILHNLLMNALQALESVPASQRELYLSLSAAGKYGQLAIKDSGPGIANNVVTRIFEPFFTTRNGALGLGLCLCETLTHSMGGSLTAFNRVPRGAEFCLSLPLAG